MRHDLGRQFREKRPAPRQAFEPAQKLDVVFPPVRNHPAFGNGAAGQAGKSTHFFKHKSGIEITEGARISTDQDRFNLIQSDILLTASGGSAQITN